MALMGRKSKSVIRDAVKSAPTPTLGMTDKMPEQPKKFSVTEAANGGFIVRASGGQKSEYNVPDEVYENYEGLEGCMKKHFGGKKKDS